MKTIATIKMCSNGKIKNKFQYTHMMTQCAVFGTTVLKNRNGKCSKGTI